MNINIYSKNNHYSEFHKTLLPTGIVILKNRLSLICAKESTIDIKIKKNVETGQKYKKFLN